jgi:hypothetical protein
MNRRFSFCTNPQRGPPVTPFGGETGQLLRPQTATSGKSMTFPAAQNLGVGLWLTCRGQACGEMLGAMAHIAPARPGSSGCHLWDSFAQCIRLPPDIRHQFFSALRNRFVPQQLCNAKLHQSSSSGLEQPRLSRGQQIPLKLLLRSGLVVNSELRTGTRPSVRMSYTYPRPPPLPLHFFLACSPPRGCFFAWDFANAGWPIQ